MSRRGVAALAVLVSVLLSSAGRLNAQQAAALPSTRPAADEAAKPINILLISSDGGWEFQTLRNLIQRRLQQYRLSVWQQNADAEVSQASSSAGMKIAELPRTLDSLLGDAGPKGRPGYQVVILFDPQYVKGSFDEEFARILAAYVRRGGGLCCIAGTKNTDDLLAGKHALKDLADLLPVTLAGPSSQPASVPASQPTAADIDKLIADLGNEKFRTRQEAQEELVKIGRPALEAVKKAIASDDPEIKQRAQAVVDAIFLQSNESARGVRLSIYGTDHSITRLDARGAFNEKMWAALPRIYWSYRVHGVRAGAHVLLENPDNPLEPLLAVHSHGRGRVMYVGTNETWRWQGTGGGDCYKRFWMQAVEWLGTPRSQGTTKGEPASPASLPHE